MKKNEQIDTSIMTLGTAKIPSPVEGREGFNASGYQDTNHQSSIINYKG
ncbi:MAG: hypothetical protein JRJ17_04665 [Deltaproteobacteria bacterium]|nr:hypothetical protein [Deltaproteobacteria bacterium]